MIAKSIAILNPPAFGRLPSMKWLDIPAHRVLEVEHDELMKEFDLYDDAGKLCSGGRVYLLFRKRNGRR